MSAVAFVADIDGVRDFRAEQPEATNKDGVAPECALLLAVVAASIGVHHHDFTSAGWAVANM